MAHSSPTGDESLTEELANVETLILAGRDQIEAVLDEIQAGNVSKALRQRLEALEAELDGYKVQRETLRDRQAKLGQPMIVHRVEHLLEVLQADELDQTEVNTLLRQVFSSVTLDRQGGTLVFEWQQGERARSSMSSPKRTDEPPPPQGP